MASISLPLRVFVRHFKQAPHLTDSTVSFLKNVNYLKNIQKEKICLTFNLVDSNINFSYTVSPPLRIRFSTEKKEESPETINTTQKESIMK